MYETILEEINRIFPQKGILTLEEVCKFLECDRETVYNWSRRSDPKRQPPRLKIGKALRFPAKELAKWLVEEQVRGGLEGN